MTFLCIFGHKVAGERLTVTYVISSHDLSPSDIIYGGNDEKKNM